MYRGTVLLRILTVGTSDSGALGSVIWADQDHSVLRVRDGRQKRFVLLESTQSPRDRADLNCSEDVVSHFCPEDKDPELSMSRAGLYLSRPLFGFRVHCSSTTKQTIPSRVCLPDSHSPLPKTKN